jgi:FHS family Na+ dependent glucose MFS transporter 1
MQKISTDFSRKSFTSGNALKTIAYYAAFVILGLAGAVIGPTLPRLAELTSTQLDQISFIFPARAFGYLLGSLLAGRIYDRLPGNRVMAAVMVLMAAGLLLAPNIPILWLLTAVLMLVSLGSGALDVGGNTLLVWVHREKVGPFMNGLHFFFGVGAFLAPVIVAQLTDWTGGIQWGFWTLALLALPVILFLVMQPSPAPIVKSEKGEMGRSNPLLVVLVAVFFFLYVGSEVGFGDWVYTYALKLKLADEVQAAYLTSVFWGALTVGRLLAIPIAARFRPRIILMTDLIGCLLSSGLILVWFHSPAALWIGAAGLGLCMASIFPMMISYAERRMTITGQTTSFFFVGASLGGMFLPWMIGQFFEKVSPHVTIQMVFVDLILATILFFVMTSRANHPSMVESVVLDE